MLRRRLEERQYPSICRSFRVARDTLGVRHCEADDGAALETATRQTRSPPCPSALARSDPGLLTKNDPQNDHLVQGGCVAGMPRRARRPVRGWDTKTLRAFGADETASFIPCPRARPVLRMGLLYRSTSGSLLVSAEACPKRRRDERAKELL